MLAALLTMAFGCTRSKSGVTRPVEESARLVPHLFASGAHGEYGYVDRSRAAAFPARFASARRFREGRAAVATPGGKWGFIDGGGQIVIAAKYDMVGDFRNGRARVFHFKKPILGPLMGLVLKPGEVTEASVDLSGKEAVATRTQANMLPELAPMHPVFDEHDAQPTTAPARWEEFVGSTHRRGLREKSSGREVLPPEFEEFRFIEDVDGSGVKFLAAQRAETPGANARFWEVFSPEGVRILSRATDVGGYASEGTFAVSLPPDSFWGAVDATGRTVVAPLASGAFAFRDGIAETFVADVGVVFVSRQGVVFAEEGYIEAQHRRVGRRTLDTGGAQ